ncbi:MAG TPA: response regulator [Candidatus Excrementavichristensenella intestinipullorum]|nr:response regulator [Candidatus Excrementavichristensenella intestinipullorum]
MDKVLVVDDEKLICEGMRRALEGLALFQVHTAASGLEALKLLETEDIQGMLLDIAMPDMDGLELMRRLSQRPERPFTMIISGYEEFAYAQQALTYGAVDYVLKPVDAEDVARMGLRLYQLIQDRRARREHTEKMHQFVLEHRDAIKQKLLTDILEGQIVSRTLEDMRAVYGIHLDGEYFMAAVIYLCRGDEGVEEVAFQVALKAFEEELNRLVAQPCPFHINLFNMENARYVLLLAGAQPLDGQRIQSLLDQVLQAAAGVEGLKCYAGKGDQVRGLNNLSASYVHANEALDYRALFGSGVVYDIGDYRKNPQVLGLSATLEEIQGHLRFQRFDQAETGVRAIFQRLGQRGLTQGQIRFFTLRLMLVLSGILVENGMDAPEGFWQDVLTVRGQLNQRTLPRVQARALHMLEAARRALQRDYSEQHRRLAQQVKEHIQAHYADNRLSVNHLSALFNYSPNYLGNVFKRAYGVSVNDYINQYRVGQAKALMDETHMKVYEIAFQVGFNDQHYFSKIFKKYQGVSPTEYRSQG